MELEFFDAGVFQFANGQLRALFPFLALCLGLAFTTVASGLRLPFIAHKMLVSISLFVFALVSALHLGDDSMFVFGTSLLVNDNLRWVNIGLACLALVALIFVDDVEYSEWSSLMLISVCGMGLLVGAQNWIAFFVFLETMAVPAYIMAAFKQRREGGYEAGIKYLMMGAFASGILLMGMTLLYGATGSFDYSTIFEVVTLGLPSQMVAIAALLIVVALGFKVALAPMHMWAADIYQSAPASLAAFMAGAGKLSVFSALILALSACGLLTLDYLPQFFSVVGVLSIFVGNLLALKQRSIRRMLAYSSVASAGYVALVVSLGEATFPSVFIYLVTYGLALSAAFAVIESLTEKLAKDGSSQLEISDLAKLPSGSVGIEIFVMTIALFSMAGIPPMPGFLGKYLLISDLWGHNQAAAFWIVLGSLMGLAYYLRILVPLYFEKSSHLVSHVRKSHGMTLISAVFSCVLLFVWIWIYANYFGGSGEEVLLSMGR